mmetsp:Transcript_41317/g.74484  ORF Transcript_41317/g.74484 Transcript_41317/m.74484 type:complete len:642 (+) Transcript_41317:39-1964(+)
MDNTALSNREWRRNATATRRAARENVDEEGESCRDVDHNAYKTPERPKQQQRQQPLGETNLLSSLSQALTNIDKHNTDYFSGQGGGDSSNGHGLRHDDSETITFASPNNNNIHDAERKPKVYSKLPPPPSQFSSYFNFNRSSLNCLLLFATCYLLVLICCYPMISYSNVDELPNDDEIGAKHHVKRGASFQHIRGRKQFIKASHAVTEKLGTLKERAVQWEEQAKLKAKRGAVEWQETEKEIIDSIAGGTIGRKDGADARRASLLLEHAVKDFEGRRTEMEKEEWKKKQDAMAGGHDHWADAVEAWDEEFVQDKNADNNADAAVGGAHHKGATPGFMVLGMHRSGTSMLSGLLVKGFGYETGGPLIGASFDNEKGFYERIDVVLQNDEFMGAQNAGWSFNVGDYDSEKALQHKQQGKITFKEGKKALKFLNNHMKSLPYLQKDPRMCITLPTWLKLLDDKPAIVFTYRHPLEVAMSLKHREQNFAIEHGLRLWIMYNMRALQNSEGLCRVFSTNEAVFKDPMTEVQRIKNELTMKCRVIAPPTHELSSEVVDEFVDPKLQHNSKERKAEEEKRGVLKDFGDGCVAREFESDYPEATANRKAEVAMYLMAMGVFCDLENGKAYRSDYEWPDLAHWQRPAKIN